MSSKRPERNLSLWAICVVALMSLSCSKGITPPSSTSEVYILEGLLISYGAAVPCYGAGINQSDIEENAERCSPGAANPIKPQYPTVPVQLRPFAVDQTEVSNVQYRHCVAAGVCKEAIATSSFKHVDYYFNPIYDDFPVNNVTWEMADTYCQFRGRRLLHDAEWQRIAQGNPAENNGLTRLFPAEGVDDYEDCSAAGDSPINAAGCNAEQAFSPVDSPDNDFVIDGYAYDDGESTDAMPTRGRIYHLFSNVSEWVDDWYDAEITCKSSIRDLPDDPNDPDDWGECLDYQECEKYPKNLPNPDNPALPGAPNQERILCEQEAKFCEACANNPEGIVQDGEAGTLSCFLSCQGLSKGYPMCETYDASDFPLALSDIKGNQGLESKRILRGGNVGIIAESQMCRFKSDYRQFRAPESGTQDNLNNATGNGVGFRCARDLSDNEVTFFEAQGFSFAEVTSQPASSSPDIDAGGSADTSGSSTDAGSETTEDTSTDASALDDTSSIDDTETSAGDDAGPTPTDADTGDETEAGAADTSEDETSGDTEDDKDDAEDKSDSSSEEPTS